MSRKDYSPPFLGSLGFEKYVSWTTSTDVSAASPADRNGYKQLSDDGERLSAVSKPAGWDGRKRLGTFYTDATCPGPYGWKK